MKNNSKKKDSELHRQVIRVLKVLSKTPNDHLVFSTTNKGICLVVGGNEYGFSQETISALVRDKYAALEDDKIIITEAGSWHLKRKLNPEIDFTKIQGDIVNSTIKYDSGLQAVSKNLNESPLSRLFLRKTKSGKTYLTQEEFEAGERFRKDFERGQLQPRISASLSGCVGSSGSSHQQRSGDITDLAIDSRKKINSAIKQLGPELSGIALDVCCFLKGLETVERERFWPPRSAKLMLKTSLSVLARHYGISGHQNTRQGKTHFWGSADYRPML